MKNFFRAYKYFLKLSFKPVLVLSSLFFIGLLIFSCIQSKTVKGDDDYYAMLGVVGTLHFFAFVNVGIGTIYTRTNKFFMSTKIAKSLYTSVPIMATLTYGLIYDIIIGVMAYFFWDISAFSDILIVNAFSTIVVCGSSAFARIPKLNPLVFVSFGYLLLIPKLPEHTIFKNDYSFPVVESFLISACIYIIGTAMLIFLLNIWWSKTEKNLAFDDKQQLILNLGGIQ